MKSVCTASGLRAPLKILSSKTVAYINSVKKYYSSAEKRSNSLDTARRAGGILGSKGAPWTEAGPWRESRYHLPGE